MSDKLNANTIKELIAEKTRRLDSTFDQVESATLESEIKDLKKKLNSLHLKEAPEMGSRVISNAPIIGDRKKSSASAKPSQFVPSNNGSSFISLI